VGPGEEEVVGVCGLVLLKGVAPLIVFLLVDGLRGLEQFLAFLGDDLGLVEPWVVDLHLELLGGFALLVSHHQPISIKIITTSVGTRFAHLDLVGGLMDMNIRYPV
jgi:hypothetical protein